MDLSGYYSYDVQWVRVERVWYYRHVLFDLINKMPVAELLSDNENDETVEKFIDKLGLSGNRPICLFFGGGGNGGTHSLP